MKIAFGNNCVILSDDRGSYTDFVPFLQQQIITHYQGKNVVIDLLKYTHITLDELLELLILSNTHRAAKNSFVIVNDAVDPDEIPEELVVVPTLQEAEDVIEMEEIERDLGF
jgi:hypothetical protein